MRVIENKKSKSNKLADKLISKKFLLQFIPQCLIHLEQIKMFKYKDQNLKADYIIDIVSNLLLKYYFKQENKYTLNSKVLKDKYGYLYNYYIDYLIDSDIIKLIFNYKKGVKSRIYALNPSIFRSQIKRYKNFDKVLLKKYKKKLIDIIDINSIDINNNSIDVNIREKLIEDLYSVKIDVDKSIFFLNSLNDRDLDIYNRNLYSIECINNKHIFYHFDNYGRLHSNFTILRSFIRKNCLLIDGGNTYEIDIKNSQPLFLFKLIKDSNTNWVNKIELELFEILVKNGNFYQYLVDKLMLSNKNEAKNMTYKVFFGKNYKSCKYSNMFAQLFPTIFNYIKLYKKEMGDYKSLAYSLQREESNFLFNTFIRKIMSINANISIITIHDSVIINNKHRDLVSNIFKNELDNYLL